MGESSPGSHGRTNVTGDEGNKLCNTAMIENELY